MQSLVHGSPAMADRTIYFGDMKGYLYAIDAETGAEHWRFKTRDRIFSSPVVAEGVVYIGSDDGYLYALSGATTSVPKQPLAKRAVYWEASQGFNWFRAAKVFERRRQSGVARRAAFGLSTRPQNRSRDCE